MCGEGFISINHMMNHMKSHAGHLHFSVTSGWCICDKTNYIWHARTMNANTSCFWKYLDWFQVCWWTAWQTWISDCKPRHRVDRSRQHSGGAYQAFYTMGVIKLPMIVCMSRLTIGHEQFLHDFKSYPKIIPSYNKHSWFSCAVICSAHDWKVIYWPITVYNKMSNGCLW